MIRLSASPAAVPAAVLTAVLTAVLIVVPTLLLAAAPARAASWTVDPAKSRLDFTGSTAGTPFSGRFERWRAQIDFDPAHPQDGHALVTIDMASAVTGDPQKDQALPGPDWFAAGTFPEARFEATSFQPKGATAYQAGGTLTIRGMARPVTLPFTLELAGAGAHATGRLELLRTDYGVGQGNWSTAQWVATEVTVTFDLSATPSGR